MASYLNSYLSAPRRPTFRSAGGHGVVIRRYNPYTSQNTRALNVTPTSAPFSGQDMSALLLQQQIQRQATAPSSDFTDNYNYDPIQARIQALGSQSVANAQTNAAQIRNEAGINAGDPALLQSLGFDANTVNAASQNPQSLLAQLNVDYANRQRQLADSMNAQNLYYSGSYQQALNDLAKGHASEQANIGDKLRQILSGADQGVLASQEAARQQELQAQIDAQAQAAWQAQNDAYQQSLLAALAGMSGAPTPAPSLPMNPAQLSDQASGASSVYVDPLTGQTSNLVPLPVNYNDVTQPAPPLDALSIYLGNTVPTSPTLRFA